MKKGFTLIELIIVIIIIGVLATLAVPQYLKSTERAKAAKAKHAMGIIAQAEKMYRADNDTYINIAEGTANTSPGLGDFSEIGDIDLDPDWTYDITDADTDSFTLIAVRVDGNNAGEQISLTEAGVWTDAFTP
ncbi:MAG: prepilin-type N-terminal cleavage/methylation domain-containing protein [Candidatus Omnitrophota bacterium]|jgi:prepilin-type N-terminal cleavage/methylation domain-containing protein